jgi:hypothetical protein
VENFEIKLQVLNNKSAETRRLCLLTKRRLFYGNSEYLSKLDGPAHVEYIAFQDADNVFNIELVGRSFTHLLVTLQRRAKSKRRLLV